MAMPLEKWQQHLEGHFAALASSRATSGLPTFALEHGLADDELDDIFQQLRERVAAGMKLGPHWLLWVVYATERGYTYSGDEYWRSFEEQTPGWDFKDRYKLSGWFSKFQTAFHGATPTGLWAEQFRIIALPITHAVLPRYLQRHFAKALYDLRFRLAALTSIEPASIGRMIAANYYGSSRFEEFLQQEELVGRIVLALLHREPVEGHEPLLPSTLGRITNDLEKVRSARDWLRETSSVVRDRFRGIGQGTGLRGFATGEGGGTHLSKKEPLPDIRPELLLRYAGNKTWTLRLDVPNFNGIAAINADIRNFLKRTRCSLNGAEGKQPAGWLLSGNRIAVLKNWPNAEKPLVTFDVKDGTIEHLLQIECRMTAGPVWLFRIGSDGLGREIRSHVVRPGNRYVLAVKEPVSDVLEGMQPCHIDCKGIHAVLITVPSEVGADYAQWLSERGITTARTIRVWPAGLPGRSWDGEGRSEWLTTEKPCFGILPDHPVESYVLSLNGETSVALSAGEIGRPTFVQLPPLAPGVHLFTIRARGDPAASEMVNARLQQGYAELRVREPEPWLPGTASHAGLIVTADPHDARLDAFWENRLALTVIGPAHHHVTATVVLENSRGDELLREQVGAPIELPIKPDSWRKHFADFLRREQCEWRYLEATAGVLKINGEELGEFSIRFEHKALPLRWVLRHDQGRLTLRLVDDTGQEDAELRCFCFSMETPMRTTRLDASSAFDGLEVNAPGALFIAQQGQFQDSVIVSAGLTGSGFGGLGVSSNYSDVVANPTSLLKVLHVLHHWRRARIAGFLADARREQVTSGLLRAFYAVLCGAGWERAESSYLDKPDTKGALDVLQAAIGHHGGFPAVLRRDAGTIGNSIRAITTWYTDLAQRYRVCRDPRLCEFALRLAGQPYRIIRQHRDDTKRLLAEIQKCPALLRGARMIALVSANNDGRTGAIVPRWNK